MRTRRRMFELLEVGGSDDIASRVCDAFLITLIAINVGATMLESLKGIGPDGWALFQTIEIVSVAIFSVEYLLRIWSVVESHDPRYQRPLLGRLRYLVSPMALVDLLAILPIFLAAFVPVDLRFLRVLRILRILKLSHYFSALNVLLDVVRSERQAFGAAFFLLIIAVLFASSGIYLFEHEAQPQALGSIPASMWWAIVTLTTVGYGDVSPVTVGGKVFGAAITLISLGMVALPTGILASGFSREFARRRHLYVDQVEAAMEDGVIDEKEGRYLEALRRQLDLRDGDVSSLDELRERLAESAAAQIGAALSVAVVPECPHCGKPIDG